MREAKKRTLGLFITLVLVALSAPDAEAREGKLVCTFDTFHQRDSFIRQRASDFRLIFGWNDAEGTAYVMGNQGRNEVERIQSFVGTTFLERLPTGVVQSTTVATSGEAVHSRHTIIGIDLVPSQYYGRCEGL